MKNIVKFFWDIGKALHGLHSNMICHGDSRVDNIGIRNGRFVLFDFDGSSKQSVYSDVFLKDYYDLAKSVKFRMREENFKQVKKFIPEPDYNFLECIMKINSGGSSNPKEIIEKLDSLEIIL